MSNRRRAAVVTATLDWPRGFVAPAKSAKLAQLLENGERVLWTGHADVGSALRTQIALWWLGMPWTIGALVLISFNVIPQDWRFLVLVVGGVFLAAPFLLAFHAAGAIYAITDRRAIIKRDALGQKQTVMRAVRGHGREAQGDADERHGGTPLLCLGHVDQARRCRLRRKACVPGVASRAGGRRPARPHPQARQHQGG